MKKQGESIRKYNEWLKKFAIAHDISIEEAEECELASIMKNYYIETESEKVEESEDE